MVLALLLTASVAGACSKNKDEPVVAPPPSTATTAAPTTTTTVPLTRDAVVLSPNGLGLLRFGDPPASVVARLSQALGPPDKETPVPTGASCGATRALQWPISRSS
jgi:hypothetical protein